MSAREEMLARVRAALGPAAGEDVEVPRGYRTRSDATPAELLDLLTDRLVDYRATVRRTDAAGLAATVAEALAAHGARRVVVPGGLPSGWLADAGGVEPVIDDALSAAALDELDGAVTGAALAIAETGTIVLDGSPDQGRRAVTLVPDYHLCVVATADVVGSVPEALARLDPTRPLTFVSGPSATSDIELRRVEGVHGPRTLEVVLVDG